MAAKLRDKKPAVPLNERMASCMMDPACWVRKKCQASATQCNGSCAKDAEPGADAYTDELLLWPGPYVI